MSTAPMTDERLAEHVACVDALRLDGMALIAEMYSELIAEVKRLRSSLPAWHDRPTDGSGAVG